MSRDGSSRGADSEESDADTCYVERRLAPKTARHKWLRHFTSSLR